MKRREFLKAALAAPLVSGAAGGAKGAVMETGTGNAAAIPRRAYGSNGVALSVVGFGGIVVANAEPEHAKRVVAEAVERGVDYFDVAPSYGDAEVKLGPALAPYRKKVFLACKTAVRDRDGAETEFQQSLERLQTDYFDLYQLHGLVDVEADLDRAFGQDGAMEVLIEKKKSGQVRHLGFSAHTEAVATAAMDRYDFDSVLFPINFACWYKGDFGPRVLAKAQEKGVARLAIKAMARQQWGANDPNRGAFPKCWYEPASDAREASMALRWTLSQPVTAAVPPGEEALFRRAMDLAAGPLSLSDDEQAALKALADTLNPIFHTPA